MTRTVPTPGTGALRRLLARPAPRPPAQDEPATCELCAEPLPGPGHRHLVDLTERALRCACRACALLFDAAGAAGGRYRPVPDRRWWLPDLAWDDDAWDSLAIPVGMAFLFYDSGAGRTVAFYPSPAGAVESLLDLATWDRLVADNPVLAELTPDVEALLVNRSRGAREHWLVPVDDCYALVGAIRTHWQGLAGGPRVWEHVDRYLAELRRTARTRTARTRTTTSGTAGGTAWPRS